MMMVIPLEVFTMLACNIYSYIVIHISLHYGRLLLMLKDLLNPNIETYVKTISNFGKL